MRKVITSLLLVATTLLVHAQTKVNPATQINWPVITGTGTPAAAGISCGSGNYGQPYQNIAVTPNAYYTCGSDGWVIRGSVGTVTGISIGSGWPAWLSPTISNPTTTPSISVTLTTIPNSALQNSSITISGVTCTLGGTCTVSGGSGCGIGTCIVNAGTASQTIAQGSNYFQLSNTNTAAVGSLFQQIISLNDNGPGYDLGNNGTTATGWSTDKAMWINISDSKRGIFQGIGINMNHNGQGDTSFLYAYLNPFGGAVAASDETITPLKFQSHQKGFPTGVAAGSPTAGASVITTNSFNCNTNGSNGNCSAFAYNNSWDDGGIVIDFSQAGSAVTVGSTAIVNGGIVLTLSSGTTTVSSAVGNIIGSSCTNNGNGQFQTYTLTTCNVTITLGTFAAAGSGCSSSTPTGTSSDIGLVGNFQDEGCVSSVGTPSGGIQSVSFYTRYAWNTGTPLIMQGGPVGRAFITTGSASTWPIAWMIMGATSSTTPVISNCIANSGCASGTYPSASASLTSYPAAFIIGSSSAGSSIYLGLNHMSVANGDTLLGAPTSEYAQTAMSAVYGQTTPWSNFMSGGYLSQDDGPFPAGYDFWADNNSGASKFNMILQTGQYQYWLRAGKRPSAAAFFIQDNTGGNYPLWSDYYLGSLNADVTNGRYGSSIPFEATQFYDLGITGTATNCLYADTNGLIHGTGAACGSGGGGLSSFTTGNLSPLFTASLGGAPTTSPALAFTLSNATQNFIFAGPSTGGTGAPSYRAMVTGDLPTGIPNANLANTATTVNGQSCVLGGSCTVPTNVCGGSGTSCPIQQINPNSGGSAVTTTTASITTSSTTIPVGSCAGYTFAPGSVVALWNNSPFEFAVASACSAGNLTITTRGFWGTTPIAWASGTSVYQVIQANSLGASNYPYYTLLSNGASSYGNVGNVTAGVPEFYSIIAYNSANLAASLFASTVANVQYTQNVVISGGVNTCNTAAISYNLGSLNDNWIVGASGSGCNVGTYNVPATAFFITPAGPSVTPSSSTIPAMWVLANGTVSATLGFQIDGTAPSGHCLIGNGTIYADSATCGSGSSTPPLTYEAHNFAVSSNGSAFISGGFGTYNANQPAFGSVGPSTTSIGYAFWGATWAANQYAELNDSLPPYWNSVGAYIEFYSTSTSGSSVIDIQTACPALNGVVGSPTWSSSITTTTAVSSTANGLVRTAFIPNIASNGTNGCSATGTTTPSGFMARVFVDSTNAVPVYMTKFILVKGRTQ